ncbi:MAG TPA: DoxX family protein [Gammaproteobacteria bacterium]|jgi:putative oxidoreductase|nr:DoxX family protein [Gammaproteobacteria bacterium]
MRDVILVAARILLAALFIWSGWNKLVHYETMQGYMVSYGLPGWSMPVLILWELGGGLLLLAGAFTRPVAWALAAFSVISACIAHSNFADLNQFINFMKNLGLAGGYLYVAMTGAGRISLDSKLRLRWA